MPRSSIYDALLKETPWESTPADAIIAKLIPRVPPGKALRERQRVWASYLKKHELSVEDNPDPYSTDDQIRMGARSLINKHIGSAVKNNHIEVRVVAGRRVVNRVPRRMINVEDIEDARRLIADSFPSTKFVVDDLNRHLVIEKIVSVLVKE